MANIDTYRFIGGKIEKPEDLKAIREFSPTVLIGLGGTGKEVLLRLRRKFFEKYGSLSEFPIVSYISIDTDTVNKFMTTEAEDIISSQVKFDQDEVVDASIESTAKYTSNLDNYPHIKKWFYPGLSALGNLREGAGQIRAYGRLGFFHTFDIIEDKIRKACQKVTNTTNAEIMLQKHGIVVNLNNVNIYIITSLAGGTGSGIFLDVAFLVKQLQQNARTVGFLVLPRIFGNEPRYNANGYAALMELEYYSYGHDFEAGWRGHRSEELLSPPPFDYCYLIDGVNESGASIGEGDKSRIFELLADNIFIDFSMSDFAAFKRGVRINLAQYLNGIFAFVHYAPESKEIMTETFPCRYFSFGLSSIGFPLDRIKNACAYKLGLDIVQQWIKLAQAPRPTYALRDDVLKEFLPEIGLLEGPWGHTVRHDITEALYKHGDSFGEDFKRKINGWAIGLRTNVHNNLPKVENVGWKQFLRNEIDKHLLLCREDVDPANCGEYIRIMDDNKREFLTVVKKKIESKIADIVGNPFKGVGFCLETLKEIGIIFTAKEFGYIPKFESEQKSLEGRLKNLKKKYEDILDEIGIIENEFWKINPQRKIALNFNLNRLVGVSYNYFWTIIQFRARKLAIEVCNEILEYFGVQPVEDEEEKRERSGKANELANLYTKISRLESEFEKKYKYYSEPIENPLKRAIYSKNDIEQKYYPQYMGNDKQSKENNIHVYSQRVLETLKINLIRLPNLIEEVGTQEVEKRIVELTKIQFEKLGEDFNVLNMFFTQKGTEGGYTEEIGKSQIQIALNAAQPWLHKDEKVGQFKLDLYKQRCFVGGHELTSGAPNSRAQDFMKLVKSQRPTNASEVAFYETLDKNEILFYTEIAGFPLAYSDTIRLLRPQYKQLIERNTELHIDYVSYKFKDLLMLTTQEREKLQEAQKSFLLGTILGIVKPELDKHEEKVIYKYDMRITIANVESQFLGFEDKAISTLFEKDEVRESIHKAVDEEIARLGQEDKLIYLDALCSWYIDNIYKSEKIELPGGVLETKAPPERLILIEVMRMIEKKVSTNETELTQLKKDIDSFSKEIHGKRVLDRSLVEQDGQP